MNTRFFDVLHDACDVDLFTIAKRINVEFDRARKVAVKQHRAVAGHNNRLRNVAFQLRHIAHYFHSAATQNIRRTNNEWKTDVFRNREGFGVCGCDAIAWLLEVQLVHKGLETLAIFCQVNRIRRGAKDRNALCF